MDLSTTYLGLNLRTPIVPSAAAVLSEDVDNIRRMEDAGASAVILHSLFEEQLLREKFELNHHLEYGTNSFAEALTYFPEPEEYHVGPELYLEHIRKAKELVDIPIIASLNGFSSGGWVEYSKLMQEAGANAIELNIYYVPTDFDMSGAQVEENYITTLREVKAEVTIPVAMKLSPFFSNMANMAKRLDEAGVDGLALFNRFIQPDINPEELEIEVSSVLSSPHDMRLPMRWIAILYGRINADLAATSGVARGHDAIKMLMAGAKVTHVCSALLRHGIGYIQVMEDEMKHWMEEHEYESVKQMQGSMSQRHCDDESAYERAQYMKAITSYVPEHSLF
ncbi:MAG: dihydroorotate dehydrogenase-like protein [Arthrospira sp. SH-MAG29]|nr:dihydroorotate dehydrogenase-like protein [Arthrospira sp. SH-MAG29]MBS0017423.1 dihydroorotate dehydrogenase-like protein [Arthrospira sp. SH-MAG29]